MQEEIFSFKRKDIAGFVIASDKVFIAQETVTQPLPVIQQQSMQQPVQQQQEKPKGILHNPFSRKKEEVPLQKIADEENVFCTCGNNTFRIKYEQNFCEAGEAFRLFCKKCNKEQDWHAKGNIKKPVEEAVQ